MPQQGVLEGKVSIVTGARRGIGKAEAVALAAQGSAVVICDIVYDDLVAVRDSITDAGGRCLALECDVRDGEQIHDVVNQTLSHFGSVDILVNNAQGAVDPVEWENIDDDIIHTSLYSGPVASLRFMQACFPHMKKQKWGRIINTASGVSRGGVSNFGHYAMSKGAIASLTYAAATDWSRFGITVNVIYPAILTDGMKAWMDLSPENRTTIESSFPIGHPGDTEKDLAPVVVFLASDAAGYLTGHPFYIDGGAAYAPR